MTPEDRAVLDAALDAGWTLQDVVDAEVVDLTGEDESPPAPRGYRGRHRPPR